MKCCKLLAVLLLSLFVSQAVAQQSTTGPNPSPDLDMGLRPQRKLSEVLIPGVPSYIWHHGCGPTAVGMVVGYWDGNGRPDLVPGSAATQTSEVDAMMANDSDSPSCGGPAFDHYQDYSCPIDNSPNLQHDRSLTGGTHADNCVADFMQTSKSVYGNYYGWSWFSDVDNSWVQYVNSVCYGAAPQATNYSFVGFGFMDYMEEIDNGRPVVLLVDTDGNGSTDHFVTGIGYDDATGEYAIYNTWDHSVHWFQWRAMGYGITWGIYGLTTFDLQVPCLDADSDGVDDCIDNCPEAANAGQDDTDVDGTGDLCDNCPLVRNPAQDDSDGDSVGDSCDVCPGYDDLADFDGDTVADSCDNCPEDPNPGQEDEDEDNIGDVCDGCCGQFTAPPGLTGNCNCSEDGKFTLSDITKLIDHVYVSKDPLCCEASGNTNGSEDCKITLSDITVLIDAVYISKTLPAECMSECEI